MKTWARLGLVGFVLLVAGYFIGDKWPPTHQWLYDQRLSQQYFRETSGSRTLLIENVVKGIKSRPILRHDSSTTSRSSGRRFLSKKSLTELHQICQLPGVQHHSSLCSPRRRGLTQRTIRTVCSVSAAKSGTTKTCTSKDCLS